MKCNTYGVYDGKFGTFTLKKKEENLLLITKLLPLYILHIIFVKDILCSFVANSLLLQFT